MRLSVGGIGVSLQVARLGDLVLQQHEVPRLGHAVPTVHEAGHDLLLAESVQTCCRVLADASPVGSGIAEPVTQPWDRQALSSLCRTRSPAPVMLVVVGGEPERPLLGLAPGQDDGTVAAQNTGVTVPYGLLLGPSVVREVGQDRALSVPAPQVRLVGPAAAPALWVPLLPASGPADPGGVLGRVLQHLGVTLPEA